MKAILLCLLFTSCMRNQQPVASNHARLEHAQFLHDSIPGHELIINRVKEFTIANENGELMRITEDGNVTINDTLGTIKFLIKENLRLNKRLQSIQPTIYHQL